MVCQLVKQRKIPSGALLTDSLELFKHESELCTNKHVKNQIMLVSCRTIKRHRDKKNFISY